MDNRHYSLPMCIHSCLYSLSHLQLHVPIIYHSLGSSPIRFRLMFNSSLFPNPYNFCFIQGHPRSSLMWGQCMTIYRLTCSLVVHFLFQQSLLSDITPHTVQPSSLRRSSFLPYFHWQGPPSQIVLLSSNHMSRPL